MTERTGAGPTQVAPEVATPRDDNRFAPGTGLVRLALKGAVAGAARWLVRGAPPGARRLTAPTESTLRVWAGAWQLLGAMVIVGAILSLAYAEGAAHVVGQALACVGVVGLGLAGFVAAAIESTVPPPRRPHVATPDDPFARPDTATGLVPLEDGLHVVQRPLVFHGLPIGAKAAVLDTGAGLLVWSPVDPDEALLDAVRALGEVRWILAPNPLHHLWVAPWHEAFPEAALLAAPGLAARRPDLPWTATLERAEDAPWPRDVVDLVVVRGHAIVDEVVLLHRPSRTVLFADLVQNLGQAPSTVSWLQRAFLRLAMVEQRPGPPADWKLTVADPVALREEVERILAWDPQVLVPAHGPILGDARDVVADAFAFVR